MGAKRKARLGLVFAAGFAKHEDAEGAGTFGRTGTPGPGDGAAAIGKHGLAV